MIQRISDFPFAGSSRRHLTSALHRAAYAILFGMFLLSLPNVSALIFDWLQTDPPVSAEQLHNAETGAPTAIVVLSAGRRKSAPEFGGETVDALSLERIRYGAHLARETNLPVLVAGGRDHPDDSSLAFLLAASLQNDFGVTVRWEEQESTNTAENAKLSAQILRQAGISRILLVTHAWHMRRSKLAFENSGITVIPAPTAFYDPYDRRFWVGFLPSATALRMSWYGLHEAIGYFWYQFAYGFR